MYCRYCGNKNEDDSIFCENCGKQLRTEKAGKKSTFSVVSLAEKSREIAENLEKETAAKSKPKQRKPQKKHTTIGILAVAAVAVLCAAMFALVPQKEAIRTPEQKETARIPSERNNGIQTIYVADGRAVSRNNSTEPEVLYAYEFSEDGLPKIGSTVYYDGSMTDSMIHYAYEETGVTERFADCVMNAAESSSAEQVEQYAMIEYEMLQTLEAHGVDIETMQYCLIGFKDARVAISYKDGFLDFINYNDQGEKLGRKVYYLEKLTGQYTYTYFPDGKLKLMEYQAYAGDIRVGDQAGNSVRTEYEYTSGEKPTTTKYSVFKDGNGISSGVTKSTYDENGMLLTSYDERKRTTTCTYHYRKIQAPVDSLQQLFSVYEYLGIPYFLVEEDTVVEDTLAEKAVSDALTSANMAG